MGGLFSSESKNRNERRQTVDHSAHETRNSQRFIYYEVAGNQPNRNGNDRSFSHRTSGSSSIGSLQRQFAEAKISSSRSSPTMEPTLESIACSKQSLRDNLQPVSLFVGSGLDRPTDRFITTYVAALIDKERAILMIPAEDDKKEVTIRIGKNTSIGNSDKSIDCSTLLLTRKVRVYGVVSTMESDAKFPTWSAARWIATRVMPVGPFPCAIKTIGFAHHELPGSRFPIISDETPTGFNVNLSSFPVDSKNVHQAPTLGAMYTVQAYNLRRGTKVIRMPDTDFYQVNKLKNTFEDILALDEFNSNIMALTEIKKCTPIEMEMCRTKCHMKHADYHFISSMLGYYQFFVGRGSASMAAFESYMRNFGKDRYIVETSSKISLNKKGVYTSTFSFPVRDNDEMLSEVWAGGGSTMAVFAGSKPYTTPVDIRSFGKRDGRGFATVEFPRSAKDFLTSWNMAITKETIKYGPIDASDDIAYQSISSGFGKLLGSSIFQQYVAAEKPQKTSQKLTEKQKRMGGICLDQFQADALQTILYSNGISLTQAPPGSGKTALVAAVTREFLLSNDAKRVIITGTTNISVDNALSTLSGISEASLDLRPIRIASQRANCQSVDMEKKYLQSEKANMFEKYIMSEQKRNELTRLRGKAQSLKEAATATVAPANVVVDRFVTAKNAQAKFEETFTEMFGPNVIATTTSLLLRNSSRSYFKDATHILIDEASQLVPTELLAILAAFPNLKKVAIIGDEYQLEPYSDFPEDSDARRCFGTPDLVRLNKEYGEAATKLKRIYRSHPLMTTNLINTFYPYQLEAGATLENRNMAKRLNLPTCPDGTPVRAYHVDGKEHKGSNQEEATAIVEFVKELMKKGARAEDILVLTFHRNQRSLLSTMVPEDVRVKTIDSAQGQQSAITIVATTKTSQSNHPKNVVPSLQFIANQNRGTVALSRGLEATYIFGNLPQLEITPFWKPVIRHIRKLKGTVNEPTKTEYYAALSWNKGSVVNGQQKANHAKSASIRSKSKRGNKGHKKQ